MSDHGAASVDSNAANVKNESSTAVSSKRPKTCLCSDPETCQGLTAAFCIMEDPRKGFVKLPRYRTQQGDNKVREAYLRYLLPNHAVEKETPSKYIAAHHFPPSIVLTENKDSGDKKDIVPRTISKEQATRLGIEVNERFTMFDENLRRVYVVVPSYSLERSKADVMGMLNKVMSEMGGEEIEQVSSKDNLEQVVAEVKVAKSKNGDEPSTSESRCQSEAKQPNVHTILRTGTKKTSPNERSKVTFGTVTLREYPIILGDNPGGWRGPPLTIDWQHQGEILATVDKYEQCRPKIRTATEFQIPAEVRHKLLRKSGFSAEEIQKYTKKANIIRNRRKTQIELSHMSGLSEAKERWTRGLSNMTLKRGKKQKEKEYLQSALQMNNGLKKKHPQPVTDALTSQPLTEAPSSDDEQAA